MTRPTSIVIVGALPCALLLGTVALAMGSDNYRLDWFTPLAGGAGRAASSDHYAVNFTVGQTVIGTSDSSNYEGCLGYWCGGAAEYRIYLPLVLRSFT
jgi:hypothetical protein